MAVVKASSRTVPNHENFESDEEMYATYTKYYGRPVGPNTPVKIVQFELIDQ